MKYIQQIHGLTHILRFKHFKVLSEPSFQQGAFEFFLRETTAI
jgi:hypothetical protein